MGRISLEQLLPDYFGNPDDSVPIRAAGLPLMSAVMRSGFRQRSPEEIVFEGETRVRVQLGQRLWQYRQLPDKVNVKKTRTWRLELLVDADKAAPLAPGHVAVIAQEPYSNLWLQRPSFKMYSKKAEFDRPALEVPELKENDDPVEWLELHSSHDPWEQNKRYVAGISQPRGFLRDEPRNSVGDFLLGACPDFDGIVSELMTSSQIQRLLRETEEGRLVFWHPRVDNPPRMYREVIDESFSIMGIAIHQALAGPRDKPEEWFGKPVWLLADRIYRSHLNNRNREIQRRREDGPIE